MEVVAGESGGAGQGWGSVGGAGQGLEAKKRVECVLQVCL